MIRIGTSGWSYDHWTGVLYPPGMPAAGRLARYTEAFDTVELNASFYRWPPDARFASWRERLPPGFAMTVKAPRGLTHGKRLYDPEVWLERMTRGWRALGDRAGCMIVQLPPDMPRDDDRLDYFLARVPDRMTAAVELRHPTWNDDAVFHLLERHGAAYCVVSGAHIACILRATARPSCTSASTVRAMIACTRARTPTTTSGGGPSASASGPRAGTTCGRTSTTTGMGTPSATP